MKNLKLIILLVVIFFSAQFAFAGDIGNSDGYAWIEKLGWIKMDGTGATPDYGVTVGDAALAGYAWSEKTGWINFDDAGAYYAVTNDGAGNLSGHAWSEKLGYISFDDATANNYYQVTLEAGGGGSSGSGQVTLRTGTTLRTDTYIRPGTAGSGGDSIFSDYAWSELGGYINFDDSGSYYDVSTTWAEID